jgi:hypothetical protein
MKTNGSTKVVHDESGQPWLVVGTAEGYEAQRIEIAERHLFDRSWQAVRFASEQGGREGGPGIGPQHNIGVH